MSVKGAPSIAEDCVLVYVIETNTDPQTSRSDIILS